MGPKSIGEDPMAVQHLEKLKEGDLCIYDLFETQLLVSRTQCKNGLRIKLIFDLKIKLRFDFRAKFEIDLTIKWKFDLRIKLKLFNI